MVLSDVFNKFDDIINKNNPDRLKKCFTDINYYNELMDYINSLGINEDTLSTENLIKINTSENKLHKSLDFGKKRRNIYRKNIHIKLNPIKKEIRKNIFGTGKNSEDDFTVFLIKKITDLEKNSDVLTTFLKNIIVGIKYYTEKSELWEPGIYQNNKELIKINLKYKICGSTFDRIPYKLFNIFFTFVKKNDGIYENEKLSIVSQEEPISEKKRPNEINLLLFIYFFVPPTSFFLLEDILYFVGKKNNEKAYTKEKILLEGLKFYKCLSDILGKQNIKEKTTTEKILNLKFTEKYNKKFINLINGNLTYNHLNKNICSEAAICDKNINNNFRSYASIKTCLVDDHNNDPEPDFTIPKYRNMVEHEDELEKEKNLGKRQHYEAIEEKNKKGLIRKNFIKIPDCFKYALPTEYLITRLYPTGFSFTKEIEEENNKLKEILKDSLEGKLGDDDNDKIFNKLQIYTRIKLILYEPIKHEECFENAKKVIDNEFNTDEEEKVEEKVEEIVKKPVVKDNETNTDKDLTISNRKPSCRGLIGGYMKFLDNLLYKKSMNLKKSKSRKTRKKSKSRKTRKSSKSRKSKKIRRNVRIVRRKKV